MKHDLTFRGLVAFVAVIATLATAAPLRAQSDKAQADKAQSEMTKETDDDDRDHMMPFGSGLFGHLHMMTLRVDDDGDGKISASEASKHASTAFAYFDGDGDGQISMDEFLDNAPWAMPMGRRSQERRYQNRTERFKAMDADGDGNVTLAEFMAKAQESYEAADANGDGSVTIWEFRAQRKPF